MRRGMGKRFTFSLCFLASAAGVGFRRSMARTFVGGVSRWRLGEVLLVLSFSLGQSYHLGGFVCWVLRFVCCFFVCLSCWGRGLGVAGRDCGLWLMSQCRVSCY